MDREDAAGTEVEFRHSPSLPDVLVQAGCSLLVSTYQAGQLIAVGVADGEVSFAFRHFDRAMGVAVAGDRIAMGTRDQVWDLRDHPQIAPQLEPSGRYDRCFLPRSSVFTGRIQGHELAWVPGPDGEPEVWIANTLFSCLATLHPDFNFVPQWQPPFVSALAAEDRCHLNGLALRDGVPAFVTVMAQSDEPGGWRQEPTSGAILDIATGEPVTAGLSMPHSPRWYDGELFVLNSGFGRLERVDLATGARDVVALLPGYARGLAIHQGLAFVGLSRIRETVIFGAVPIAEYHDDLKCGVGVVDIATGTTVATLEFVNGIEEIFDVQVMPGARCVTLGSPRGDDDPVWVVPTRHSRER